MNAGTLRKTVSSVAAAMQLDEADLRATITEIAAEFTKIKGREPKISEVDLAELIASTDEDLTGEQWADAITDLEIELADDTEAGTSSVPLMANNYSELGNTFAPKLNTQEWEEFFDTANNAKEFTARAGVIAMDLLERTFTQEEIAQLPEWNSTLLREDGTHWTNNPDIYKVNGAGNRKIVRHKLYDIFDLSARGMEVAEQVRLHKLADGIETKAQVPEIAAKGAATVTADLKLWEGRQRYSREAFRNAVITLHKFQEVMAKIANTTVKVFREDGGAIVRSPACIVIHPTDNPVKAVPVTRSQFLRLDIVKAVAAGGTFTDLLKTLERGTKSDDATPVASSIKMPSTVDEVVHIVQMLNHFFDMNDEGFGKRLAMLNGAMGGKGGDSVVLALGKLSVNLDGSVWKTIERRYTDLEAKEAAVAKRIESNGKQAAA